MRLRYLSSDVFSSDLPSSRIFSTRNTTGPSCRCSACSSSRRAPKRATLAWKDGSASELSRPAVPDKLCRGRTFLRWSESAAPSGRCRTKNEPRRNAMNKQWAQYWIGLFADGHDELMTLYAPEFPFEASGKGVGREREWQYGY